MARKYLIATHATMAAGIRETLGILAGDTSNISVINAFTEDKDPKSTIEAFLAETPEEDELIVMTDLMAGSVNQMFMPHLSRKNFHVVTGVNLPVVLQLVMNFDDVMTEDYILETIEQAKSEIQYVNKAVAEFVANDTDDDDDDLF